VFAVAVCAVSSQEADGQDVIGFGSAWGLPGAIQFETPIGTPGGTPIEETMFELNGQVGVSKFHPDWGTLNSVAITIAGFGLYSFDYSPEIPPTLPSGLAQGANFSAQITISQSEIGLFETDTAFGGSPGLGGTLIPQVEFMGTAPTSPFIGFGAFTFDLNHMLNGNIFVDEGTGIPQPGWDGAMSGIFGGTVTVIYNFTAAGSEDGGPPGGGGGCPTCGPLPGDGDTDDFVGIQDLNLVLNNWNTDIFGWNNGDFDGNGFIGIADLNIVLGNWNAGTSPPAEATVVIPEPTSLIIIAASGLMCGLAIFQPCFSRRKG